MNFFPTSFTSAELPKGSAPAGGAPAPAGARLDLEHEPPLLEELEINIPHILVKTRAVLNPLGEIDAHIMDDTDLAGPLLYCVVFGILLLLSGKMHFGYVFGLGAIGCFAMWALLHLMSERGASVASVVSVLGYCLLPMLALAPLLLFVPASLLVARLVVAAVAVLWSTHSAVGMFVRTLSMIDQRLLVAYPVAMIYVCFAILTLF